MKPYTYALLAAAAACGLAYSETAYTTPVGYTTLGIPANSDTTVAPSLSQPPLFQGVSTGISGNTITVAATGAANNDWVNAAPDTNAKTYVLVRSGPLAGLRFPVSGNTATEITVAAGASTLQSLGFVSGNSISVVPYWTLNTLFPGGAGVGGTNDLLNPSSYVIFSDQESIGVNRAPSKLYFYFVGDAENYPDFPAGWYDNDNLDALLQNTVAIDPSVLMSIRNSSATSLTITGEVPSVSLATKLLTSNTSSNDELLGAPYPVDISLPDSGLQAAISPSTDLLNPIDFVFVYPDLGPGVNKAPASLYFYFAGDAENYPDFPAGWYDNDNLDGGVVTSAVIKAGRCFGVRKAQGASSSVTTWTAPLPYTL